jgi:hypothetical protein
MGWLAAGMKNWTILPLICKRGTSLTKKSYVGEWHGCKARGGHGLPKASPRPAMPYRSKSNSKTALQPFQGWPACRGGPLAGQVVCRRLLPLWTPHAVRLNGEWKTEGRLSLLKWDLGKENNLLLEYWHRGSQASRQWTMFSNVFIFVQNLYINFEVSLLFVLLISIPWWPREGRPTTKWLQTWF